jgi:hypothetical protein
MGRLMSKLSKLVQASVYVLTAEREKLEEARDGAQAAFDDMSERVQEGERGTKLSETISALEAAINGLEEAENALSELIEH